MAVGAVPPVDVAVPPVVGEGAGAGVPPVTDMSSFRSLVLVPRRSFPRSTVVCRQSRVAIPLSSRCSWTISCVDLGVGAHSRLRDVVSLESLLISLSLLAVWSVQSVYGYPLVSS